MYEKLAYIGFASYCLGSIGVECVGGGECYDINGRTISPGFHFVPGPDTCTLCVCDNGNPKWCKAVLCSPPQDCKSFRVGNSCCEFICLDDTFGGGKGGEHDLASEFGLRLIAGAITAILCLSIVFFSIHRLRQRKIRGRQPSLHHHSHLAQVSHGGGDPHNSAGYLSGASVVSDGGDLRYAEDDDGGYLRPPHYTLWKPAAYAVSGHGGGMPRGHEAPPPYEEAVAAAQVEAAMAAAAAAAANSGSSFVHSSSHHMSEHRTIPLTLATSECLFPQPLRPSITHHRSDMPPLAPVAPQPQRGAIVDLAPMAPPHRGPVDSVPVAPPHRGPVDSVPVAPPHRGTVDLAPVAPPHRGAVDLAPVAPPHRGAAIDLRGAVAPPHCGTAVTGAKVAPLVLPPPPKVARHNVATCTSSCPTVAPSRRTTSNPQVAAPSSDAAIINCKPRPPPLLPTAAAPQTNNVGSPAVSVPTRLAPVAMSSIAEEGQEVEDDEEEEEEEEDDSDYRSECENCNVSVMRDESSAACFEVDDLETMTLHRKPPQDHLHCHLALHQRRLGGPVGSGGALGAPQGEWTSLTLPTNTRTQRPTSVLCNSSQTSARENWFSSMPQTSSESSEEE